ncbi:hypothetical protein MTO96_025829 [Rhipicephalus appendiculatus]
MTSAMRMEHARHSSMPGFARSHWIYQRCQLSTTKFSGNLAHRKTQKYLRSSPDQPLRDLAPPWTPDAYTLYFYSGDVEENPGPPSADQEQKMFEAIMQIPSLVQTQADILNEIRSLRSDQRAIELKVTDLAVKVERAEGFASSVPHPL